MGQRNSSAASRVAVRRISDGVPNAMARFVVDSSQLRDIVTGMSTDDRLINTFLRSLALPATSFADQAADIARLVKSALHQALSHRSRSRSANATATDSTRTLALLLVFHRLTALPGRNDLVDVNLVHDIIVVCSSGSYGAGGPDNGTADDEKISVLTEEIISELLRRRPSLAVGIVKNVLPAYAVIIEDIVRNATPGKQWQAVITLRNLAALLAIPAIGQAAASAYSEEGSMWTTVHSLYAHIRLSHARSREGDDALTSLSLPQASRHAAQSFLSVFAQILPSFSLQTLVALLEAEASHESGHCASLSSDVDSDDEVGLLVDAETQYAISSKLDPRIPEDERNRVSQSLRSLSTNSIVAANGKHSPRLSIRAKGKQKAGAGDADDTSKMRSQVLAIMPEADVELVDHMLGSTAADETGDERVQAVIEALLDGRTSIERSRSVSTLPQTARDGDLPEGIGAVDQKQSAFAAARANIFTERMDEGHMRSRETRLDRDPLLPQDLKDAIKAAYARQQQEALEEEEAMANEGRRADPDASDMSDTDRSTRAGRTRHPENESGSSDVDDVDDEAGPSDKHGPSARSPYASATASGYTAAVEHAMLVAYAADTQPFTQASRKSTARAELRKNTGLADEQIEGWARMLERDPRKAKRLEAVTEFRGNVAHLTADSGAPEHGHDAAQGSGREAGRDRARGRGSKGNRGHQGERRRRGNDRKMHRITGAAGP